MNSKEFCCLSFMLAMTLQINSIANADQEYQGVKFYVEKTQKPGSVRLYRLRFKDGSHCYTINEAEVESLKRSPKRAVVEPMDAFVYTEKAPGTVRLYRFIQRPRKRVIRYFYTAFEPERREIEKQTNSKLHRMEAYVYPHTIKLDPKVHSNVVAAYWFYSPSAGEHFYTTSTAEKDGLIAAEKIARGKKAKAERERKKPIAERYTKLRNRPPQAVGFLKTPIRVGDVEWTVISAKKLGKQLKSNTQFVDDLNTQGQFLKIELRVINKGKSPLLLIGPSVFDDRPRRFNESTDAMTFVPRSKRIVLVKNLNPSVPHTFELIYDIAADSKRISLLVGDLNLLKDDEGVIDLGL